MEVTIDAVDCSSRNVQRKRATHHIEVLNSEMPDRHRKDRGKRVLRNLLNRLRMRRVASAEISRPDPIYKVAYLGNVVTGWAKGEGCVEKPLATLWRNYTQSSRPDVCMQLAVSGGGLKATTRDHGLTEYWANRLTFCAAPTHFPRIFCWIYRHESRRLRHELRCHAVLCPSSAIARQIETCLKNAIALALAEFKRDKINKQNARLSLVNCVYDNPSMPRRKILLSTGSNNYRPPLERSKSAPKLTIIEEHLEEEEDIVDVKPRPWIRTRKILRHYDSAHALLEKRKTCISPPRKPIISVLPQCQQGVYTATDFEETRRFTKVRFSESQTDLLHPGADNDDVFEMEKSSLMLDDLVQETLTELLETCSDPCSRNWFRSLSADVTPLDSDEGSLSSGCESASTVTSDMEQPPFSAGAEDRPEEPGIAPACSPYTTAAPSESRKTDSDFKVGACVLTRGLNFDRLPSVDLRKYCGLGGSSTGANLLNNDEVSLVPVGESPNEFSSLKVYKKRSHSDASATSEPRISQDTSRNFEDEDEENATDEGYDEVIDCASSVSNIVLV